MNGDYWNELPKWRKVLYLAFAVLMPFVGSIDKIAF